MRSREHAMQNLSTGPTPCAHFYFWVLAVAYHAGDALPECALYAPGSVLFAKGCNRGLVVLWLHSHITSLCLMLAPRIVGCVSKTIDATENAEHVDEQLLSATANDVVNGPRLLGNLK